MLTQGVPVDLSVESLFNSKFDNEYDWTMHTDVLHDSSTAAHVWAFPKDEIYTILPWRIQGRHQQVVVKMRAIVYNDVIKLIRFIRQIAYCTFKDRDVVSSERVLSNHSLSDFSVTVMGVIAESHGVSIEAGTTFNGFELIPVVLKVQAESTHLPLDRFITYALQSLLRQFFFFDAFSSVSEKMLNIIRDLTSYQRLRSFESVDDVDLMSEFLLSYSHRVTIDPLLMFSPIICQSPEGTYFAIDRGAFGDSSVVPSPTVHVISRSSRCSKGMIPLKVDELIFRFSLECLLEKLLVLGSSVTDRYALAALPKFISSGVGDSPPYCRGYSISDVHELFQAFKVILGKAEAFDSAYRDLIVGYGLCARTAVVYYVGEYPIPPFISYDD
jgi:hypothetical protein